ncbi:hypothetical protein [Amycolatopsis sp.]|uniref:hypothetical protein n=1 Tax=Amycolatopsis sp. TaxID=37632 RepID=UPI002D80B4B1|nr:hypothetical protein [Amycolatopsis sp.]HET6708274.1 hypothetical protein [Amycolatopsis sp.]
MPNKAQGKPARAETRFRLDVDAVFDGRGNRLADFPYDDFRGDGEIAREFGAGDAVKVTFAASTGRTVKSISRV